jgi:2-isopropylmalate synthase/UPF0716 protein FxsA
MIYFLVYLFLEVVISTNISSAIGGVNTFFELILSAFVGIILLVNFRTTLIQNLRCVSEQQIDLQRFQELNLFTIFGAFLLIIPGFLTDIIGVLLQFSVFVSILVNRFSAKYTPKSTNTHNYTKEEDNVIDVEIISDDSTPELNPHERDQFRS